ncbi:hypothetical protein KI387_007383, partial [Taxus chinensis]
MAISSSSGQENVGYDPFCGSEPHRSVSARLYDVFINHRGPDVKETLALELYNSVKELGFRPFLDCQEIELGDTFPCALKNAIYSSLVHIAIFSKTYAESPWCLAELTLMLKTKAKIIPVFYDVTPAHLRLKNGGYADSFAKYEEKGRSQDRLCKEVVRAVLKEMQKQKPKNIDVAKYPVGLDELVKEYERHCDKDKEKKKKKEVQIVGIFGMGGAGKTTLAKELFNRKRSEYDGSCFLLDVREASLKGELPSLQNKLLKDLLNEENEKFQSTDEGKMCVRECLERSRSLRFLIVVDDIDDVSQLDALLERESLNPATLVIVTTRDKRMLVRSAITTHFKMKEMERDHGRQLFCWNAFCRPEPAPGYEDLVERFLNECKGLPLALQVLGGHVFGRDKHYWQLELDKVGKTLPGNIKQRLKISFDALDREEKEVFLDIACFFVGKPKDMAMKIWELSGWSAEHALETLKDKCLVVEYRSDSIWEERNLGLRMHNHLRDLGRELADDPIYSRRRWNPQYLQSLKLDGFLNILVQTNGPSVRCLNSTSDEFVSYRITYFIGNSDDCAERSNALLWLEISDLSPRLTSIPSWIPLQNLHCLKIINGNLERLSENDGQTPFQLKELSLDEAFRDPADITNSLGMYTRLENLFLSGRCSFTPTLIEGRFFSRSLSKLANLRRLVLRSFNLTGEVMLHSTGRAPGLSSLRTISMGNLDLVSTVSISGEHCPGLEFLRLQSMYNLIKLNLPGIATLNSLALVRCPRLTTLSSNIDLLNCSERVIVCECPQLQTVPGIENTQRLKYLDISALGPGATRNCIYRLQILPSEFTIAIDRAVNGAASALNAKFFSDLISADAFTDIQINERGYPVAAFVTAQPLSGIIVCTVVKVPINTQFMLTLRRDESIWRCVDCIGEWIFTIAVTDQKDINRAQRYISHWIPNIWRTRRACLITVNNGDECKILQIFKRI